MATRVATSAAKERILLAAAAGRTAASTEETVAAGFALEERARATHRARGLGLLDRIRAHLAS